MIRVFLSALLGLSLLGGTVSAQPPKSPDSQKKDAPKDKDKAPPKDKAAVKEIVGMFKSKDLTKKTLTITVDGKDKTFKITDDTKIQGPRGGEAELKDDRLDKGYKITVVANAKNADEAAEVKLPYRDDREGADKDKAKDKSKDKPKDKDDPKSKDKPKDKPQ
jgi:hypothetical protein